MPIDEAACHMMKEEAELMAKKLIDMKNRIEQMVDTEEKTANVAGLYVALEAVNDTVTTATKELTKYGQFLSYTKLPEMMDHDNVRSVNTNFGVRVTMSSRTSVTMIDKEEGKKWLRENGYGDIIQETVNSQTLGSLVKEMIEKENIEPPNELFSVKAAPYVSVTKIRS